MEDMELRYDPSNESAETFIQVKTNSENQQSRKYCQLDKKTMVITVVFVVALIVSVATVVALKTHKSPDDDAGVTTDNGGTHGSAAMTGVDDREIVDPNKHTLKYSADGTFCNGVAKPFKHNPMEHSLQQYIDAIVNSSCLMCNGQCVRVDNLQKRIVCRSPLTIASCALIRDMKNKEKNKCGGVGSYECFSNTTPPVCDCKNNKIGDNCNIEYKLPCKCWTTQLQVDGYEKWPDCMHEKTQETWGSCTYKINNNEKCICNNTELLEHPNDWPDCAQAQTDSHVGTSCGSNVKSSALIFSILLVGYFFS